MNVNLVTTTTANEAYRHNFDCNRLLSDLADASLLGMSPHIAACIVLISVSLMLSPQPCKPIVRAGISWGWFHI